MAYHRRVSQAGVSGIHCVEARPTLVQLDGVPVHHATAQWKTGYGCIFGTKFFGRGLFETIGYFQEDYGKYGLNDRDYSYRADRAGFRNYYLPGEGSQHLGTPGGPDDQFRQFKNLELGKAKRRAQEILDRYETDGYYVPKPTRQNGNSSVTGTQSPTYRQTCP